MLIKRFEQIHKGKAGEYDPDFPSGERIIRMADRIMVITDGKVESIGAR